MQEENSYISKIKIFAQKHKSVLIAISALIIILVMTILTSSLINNKKSEDRAKTPLPSITQSKAQDSFKKEKTYNPLITNSEIERVKNAYRKKFGEKITETPKTNFQYQLSPALKSKSSYFPFKTVFAANSCNLDTAPQKVSVHTLKSHLFTDEATGIAKEFNLNVSPASLPMDDGASFQYYFSDPESKAFLTISEPSGVYTYHQAIKEASQSADISLIRAKEISDQELSKHNLLTKSAVISQKLDNSLNKFIIDYEKDYDGLKMVDSNSLKALDTTNSLCNTNKSQSMNTIQTILTKKGTLFKLVNKTRIIGKTYSFNRQTLEDSLTEYGTNPPVEPIIIGTKAKIPGEQIIIDEALLVWFDYGEEYAQISYVPMYATSGKNVNGNRVITLFPAVSKADLDKTEINDLGDTQLTLQLGTFKPQPPKPSKIPAAPGDEGCYGNLIDYVVTCSSKQALDMICNETIAVPSDNDPYGVCEKGCQNESGEIDIRAGSNPCLEFFKTKTNTPADSPNIPGIPGRNSQNFPSGAYSCTINGCPC